MARDLSLQGYFFNDNFGIDFTWTNLDSSSSDDVDIDLSYYAVSGVGKISIHANFDVYGKIGIGQLARTVVTDDDDGDDDFDFDTSETELYLGVGGKYDFGRWNIFLEVAQIDGDEAEINTVLGGVKYEF